ncbi:hypothetical protein H072_9750 [Dactylellina haptotyla CBS 200.50]|uniref:Uncharacterized protein n=1 Tax=Dactylellina haptotyla (strain CBS 200.50) TaxID=1284197 RepID=S8A1U9_DACHA|nr:hypothetical protein H072_9750 [Dactylellina haptotyla CBS 200.50]
MTEVLQATTSSLTKTVLGNVPAYVPPGQLYFETDGEHIRYFEQEPQLVHADMVCYPLARLPHILDVKCNDDGLCLPPLSKKSVQEDGSYVSKSFIQPTPPPTLRRRDSTDPVPEQKELPIPSTITIYTTIIPNAPVGYPQGQYQYPQYSPTPQPATPEPRPVIPTELIDPYHPGLVPGSFPKSCRIPKAYEGICHPIVIPCVVICTYILATCLYYGGAPHCIGNPFLHSQQQQYHRRPTTIATPQGTYIYHHPPAPPTQPSPGGGSLVATPFQRNWMGLISCFRCDHPDNDAAAAARRAERINATACYFLTTLLSYGAGLIILGAFLGGLCNCVKSECEFK